MNLGVYRDGGKPAEITTYQTWLGRPVTHVVDFVAGESNGSTKPWAAFDGTGSSWLLNAWKGQPRTVVFSVPMLPCHYWSDATGATHIFTLADGAAGKFDIHISNLAKQFKAAGFTAPIIRLGWEFNGNWMPWYCVGHEAAFAAYWRRFVTVFCSVVPGATFDLCWNNSASFNPAPSYPGDAYVNSIGVDAYDAAGGGWTSILNGLNAALAFAKAHGKPFTISEYGVWESKYGGGDNPTYITNMLTWAKKNAPLWLAYFEHNASDGAHRLMPGAWTNFPKSAAAFLAGT